MRKERFRFDIIEISIFDKSNLFRKNMRIIKNKIMI